MFDMLLDTHCMSSTNQTYNDNISSEYFKVQRVVHDVCNF